MNKIIEATLLVIGGIGLLLIIGAFTGWIVMLLWNWLLVELFAVPAITWIQGWGLIVLAGLLFKNSNTSSSKS